VLTCQWSAAKYCSNFKTTTSSAQASEAPAMSPVITHGSLYPFSLLQASQRGSLQRLVAFTAHTGNRQRICEQGRCLASGNNKRPSDGGGELPFLSSRRAPAPAGSARRRPLPSRALPGQQLLFLLSAFIELQRL